MRRAVWQLSGLFSVVVAVIAQAADGPEPVSRATFGVVEVYARVPGFPLADRLRQYPELYDWPELVLIRTRQPARLAGVAVAPNVVLTRDCMLDPAAVDRVVVRAGDGTTTSATLVGRHPTVPCLVFRTEKPVFQPLKAAGAVDGFDEVVCVRLLHVDDYWHLHKETSLPEPIWHNRSRFVIGTGLSDSQLNLGQTLFNNRRAFIDSPAVLLANGQVPVAIGFASGVHFEGEKIIDGMPISTISESELLTPELQRQTVSKIEHAARSCTVPVRVRFRKAEGTEETVSDLDALGLALKDGYVLVPQGITRAQAALIEAVSLYPDGDNPVEAEFVGALAGYEAFLIRADVQALEKLGVASPLISDARPRLYHVYGATQLLWSYGDARFQTRLVRLYSIGKSFFGGQNLFFTPGIPRNTALWDLQGRLLGVELRERDRYAGIEELLPSPPPTLALFSSRHNPGSVYIAAGDLVGWVDRLDELLDPRLKPVPPGQEHRRPWLGVEFSRLSKDLADALGCRKETRDGTIGLHVQYVYPGSPAEKAGIQTGDILLALYVPDYPRLLELTGRRRPTGSVRDVIERLMRRRMFGNRNRPTGPWPSRDNYLTELLSILGPGKDVTVIYWRAGELYTVATTIELAPPDQDSASKYEDKDLGLTVKELTYEVRAALQLASDAPGVVVAKVESGTPASQARLRPGEIIVAADDRPLRTPEDLKNVVEEARKAGRQLIRVRVVERGRSRFADLRLQ